MCSKLGPTKKVNVIIIGFPPNSDSSIAHLQEAAWIGGKKNDLILCYDTPKPNQLPTWAYVFGWTEETIVKANLQTILLTNPINDNILPLIYQEILKNYTIKEWKKFDYLQIEPPTWTYYLYILITAFTQGIFWLWASINPYQKYTNLRPTSRQFRYKNKW